MYGSSPRRPAREFTAARRFSRAARHEKHLRAFRGTRTAGDILHGAKRVQESRCVPRHHVLLRILGAKYIGDRQGQSLPGSYYEEICRSIDNPHIRDTVLTEVEMIHQLNRLRLRALRDQ